MNLVLALKGRRSQPRLCSPAFDDGTLLELIHAAAHGPDRGRLRPWRIVGLRDAAREWLGDMLADGSAEPLALYSEGWESIWRTGARLSNPDIGMPSQAAPPARRVDPDLLGKVYFEDDVSI
ncbi:hypothetical protein [Nocardia sp. CDC160]|uniref:hypothetical protein n=1 Tax=Nocardia sp. CDC160 TaxID=3112166 RepID=UPI002DBFD561|nr:hypothetical protein [Nocardia sp. CDC160]MEC3919175.1 hypothetical protein [Nocardia sp. CDC160]